MYIFLHLYVWESEDAAYDLDAVCEIKINKSDTTAEEIKKMVGDLGLLVFHVYLSPSLCVIAIWDSYTVKSTPSVSRLFFNTMSSERKCKR